jgi:hypothetical protein
MDMAPTWSFAGYPRAFTEYRMTADLALGSMPPSTNAGAKAMESQAKMRAGTRPIAGTIVGIAAGALALGDSGLLDAVDLQRGWPLMVIALGLAQLAMTMRSPRLRGWGLLLLGDWLFMNTMTDWTYQRFTLPLLLAGVDCWIISGGMTRAKNAFLNRDRHVV